MDDIAVIGRNDGDSVKGTSLEDFVQVSEAFPKGLRKAKFIEDVDLFMEGKDINCVLPLMRELLEMFRLMERSERNIKQALMSKLPSLQDALKSVQMLVSLKNSKAEERVIYYRLSETMYAQAIVPKTDTVMLWLGANTMMEYSLEEAQTLLEKNVQRVKEKLQSVNDFLDLVRVQIVVVEVNVARLHNYGVQQRKDSSGIVPSGQRQETGACSTNRERSEI